MAGDIKAEIKDLAKKKNAVILAHYYVPGDVQDIAGYIGDSFKLAKIASTIDCDVIVFCGVEFMGESAKLLSPDKKVLMPAPDADCPMAHMMSRQTIIDAQNAYDDLAVACYVNSTAEMKAWSDVCVTSSNALKIVQRLPQKNVLFIPDVHLGHYIAEQLPEKNIILNDGFCPSHEAISVEEVEALKTQYPDAVTLAHPECPAWILELADYIGSTSGIIDRAVNGTEQDYIICTVEGVIHQIRKLTEGTNKRFHFPETVPICPNMRKVTLEKVRDCLANNSGEVSVNAEYTNKANAALSRMLELAQ